MNGAIALGALSAQAGSWVLAYRPFLDPLDLHTHWFWTLVPLLVLTSMAYKGVRVRTFTVGHWLRQSAMMAAQLALLMAGLAIGLHLVVEFALPLLGG
jgi:hypothetical protein